MSQGTGDVYVVDSANNRINRFSAAGAFISTWGQDVDATVAGTAFEVCTAASGDTCKKGLTTATTANGGSMNAPQAIAVDPSTGNLYVADQGNRRIQEFDSAGGFIRAFGWDVKVGGVTTFETCTVASECKTAAASGANAGQLGTAAAGIAIGPGGNVFVAEATNRRVQKFSAEGAFMFAFGWNVDPGGGSGGLETCSVTCQAGTAGSGVGQFSSNQPTRVAVDSGGAVYTVEATGNNRVQKFTPSGAAASLFATATLSGSPAPTDVATDPTTDHVFVVKPCNSTFCPEAAVSSERRVKEFDNSGALVDTHGATAGISVVNGLGVNPSTGRVLLSSTTGGHRVYALGSVTVPPVATIGSVTSVTGTTATFSGEVNPTGLPTGYRFEYSADGAGWTSLPSEDADLGFADETAHPVSQAVDGLTGSQLYHVRLVADKRFLLGSAIAISATSLETTFTTEPAPPAVSKATATQITSSGATFSATVNPQNQETTYHFEFGLGDCASTTCTSVPVEEAGAGSGGTAITVSRSVSGLQPGTPYHVRLVATNASGTSQGADVKLHTFQAPGSIAGSRAYELVSPVDKNGGNIAFNDSVQSSLDGEAVVFSSLSGFADSPSAGKLSDYRAARGSDDWITRGISPPAVSQGLSLPTTNMLALSGDLTRSVMRAFPAPPIAPGSQLNAFDFFRRDIPDGEFENLTPVVPLPGSFEASASFGGANDAMTAIGISSQRQLTPDAPASGPINNAYVWSGGELHYVGIFPDNSSATNAVGSTIGAPPGLENHNAISSDGSQAVFTAAFPGNERSVYLRQNLTSTIEASASQRVPLDPAGPKPAFFQGASTDGAFVLFKTQEQLLDSDADNSVDLYGYAVATGTLTRLSLDSEPADGGSAEVLEVLGSSDDGSRVYFAAVGRLIPGQPATPGTSFYAWRDDGTANGALSYVATLDPTVDSLDWSSQISNKRRLVQVSENGRYLLFTARTELGEYQNAGHTELYRYDAESEAVDCVSCVPTGAPATSDASMFGLENPAVAGIDRTSYAPHNVTDDGRVFFETADALTAGDSNAKSDVYSWEDGQPALVSSGNSENDSHFGDADASGNDVFFLTSEALLAADVDSNVDLYDARVGGGLTGQGERPAAECAGEACRGETESEALVGTSTAGGYAGPGNVQQKRTQRRVCRKRKRGPRRVARKHCVKRGATRTAHSDRKGGQRNG